MQEIDAFLAKIDDAKPVRAALPLRESAEKARIACVYRKSDPPKFSLQFPDGNLPASRLDMHRKCEVLFDVAGQNISIAADIDKSNDQDRLELIGREVINHKQLRDYFRVDVSTPIVASSILPAELATDDESWRLSGETLDVSAGGLLCNFNTALDEGTRLRIELVLPTTDAQVVKAVGHVVRCRQLNDSAYQVALHFDNIEPEDQDSIMACCLEIQRKHLRLKVQVQNS